MNEPNWIEITALENYEVAPDGSSVKLNVLNADGTDAAVIVPMEHLKALTQTMPHIMTDALRAAGAGAAQRLVHVTQNWKLERADDGKHVIVTIQTPDGFDVSFALLDAELFDMAKLLGEYHVEAFPEGFRFH